MKITSKNWVFILIFNLFIVAVLGTLMRYKIAFEFPFFQQKNLLHSHSHFAFSGWISQTLFFLIILSQKEGFYKKYNVLLISNLICSYGMLFSFIVQGYGLISIILSTLSIIITYLFTYYFFKDYREGTLSNLWIKGGLFFNLISSLGTLFLAYMLAAKTIHENFYYFSIYFYLHFQYNGWFFFTIIGLFISRLSLNNKLAKQVKKYFYIFSISCILTYMLSILWAEIPKWIFILTAIFTFLQFYFWLKMQYIFIVSFKDEYKKLSLVLRGILLIVLIATTLKFILQIGLFIDELRLFVYGNRTIVIGYLHLIFLCIVTLFLLAFMCINKLFHLRKNTKLGLVIFCIGVILNQVFLFTQGGLPYFNIYLPFTNEVLVYISLLIVMGIMLLLVSQTISGDKNNEGISLNKSKL
ncbi:hypothetical protein [Flavobacterium oreochromis]|uniref:hypothetical protein n=1 Tax=Flavobacterium oreochromis TaxID=2906078 RepID=UPI00385ED617